MEGLLTQLPPNARAEFERTLSQNKELSLRIERLDNGELDQKLLNRINDLESRVFKLTKSNVNAGSLPPPSSSVAPEDGQRSADALAAATATAAAAVAEAERLRTQLAKLQHSYRSELAAPVATSSAKPLAAAATLSQAPSSPLPPPPPTPLRALPGPETSQLNGTASGGAALAAAIGATAAASPGSAPTPSCGSWLKVYVYEFPAELPFNKLAAEYLADCRAPKGKCDSQYGGENLLAQFSLELILHDFFKQSCVRTLNPEEAHLFFVPFLNDVEYRALGRPNDASPHGQAILDILEKGNVAKWEKEFRVTGKWWKRRGGADHIIPMSAPVTGLRHPKGARGWSHYMVQLHSPIFLSVELTRSFLQEYPACSAKNVVVPYPIPGRDWHNRVWRRKAEELFGVDTSVGQGTGNVTAAVDPFSEIGYMYYEPRVAGAGGGLGGGRRPQRTATVLAKPINVYYSGGNHGCVNVRAAISKEVRGDPKSLGAAQALELGRKYKQLNPREGVDMPKGPPRQVAMAGSKFCACPEGDSPSAKRQYDAILTGCIPAVVSNEAIFAFTNQNGGDLDPSDFSVRVTEESVVEPEPGVGGLLDQLARIPEEEVRRLQAGVHRAAHFYRYYAERDASPPADVWPGKGVVDPLVAGRFPDGGACEMLLRELEKRADGKRAQACAAERSEPHFYFRFQYCGRAETKKEVAALTRKLEQSKKGSKEYVAAQRGLRLYKEGWISRRRRRRAL